VARITIFMELYFLILLPVISIIAWIFTFIITHRYVELHDRVLLALMGCCGMACYIALRSLVDGTGDYCFLVLDNIETVVATAICPLLFIYIRTLVKEPKWQNWYWLLFAPGVVFCIVGTVLSVFVGWDRILEVRQYGFAPFVPDPNSRLENAYRFFNITMFNVTVQTMAIVLVGLSIHYLSKYYKKAGDYYANLEDSSVDRMHHFLLYSIFFLISLFAITYFIPDIVKMDHHLLILISVLYTVHACFIFNNAYQITFTSQHLDFLKVQEEIHEGLQKERTVSANKDNASTLKPKEFEGIEEKVAEWQNLSDKPYCDDGLTVRDAAKSMGISSRTLSEYINQEKGMNFNRWINTLRIEEAKIRLLETPDEKIGSIALDLGFTNPSAFTNVFHQMVGCSPLSYRESNNAIQNRGGTSFR